MVQIIKENRPVKPSVARSLLGGLAEGVPQAFQQYQQNRQMHQENEALKLMGIDVSGIKDPKTREKAIDFAHEMSLQKDKYQRETDLLKGKSTIENREKLSPFQAGLETVNQLRNLRNKKNIGFGSQITGIFSPETRKDRAEYETLANSLISLASTIPIRNRQEFETLTGKINDPSLTLSEIDGVLDAMERIITQNMQQFEGGESELDEQELPKKSKISSNLKKQRPPLSSFHR